MDKTVSGEKQDVLNGLVHEKLEKIFGFRSFRPGQEEIVQALVHQRDAFAVMPTGGGKSLCYQLPACVLEGTGVIISPLISLMKDQVDAAQANGIAAAFLNSSQSETQRSAVTRRLLAGELELLYVAPERFGVESFQRLLGQVKLCLIAVDEAHCVSEWGHDFRPDYLGLSALVKNFPHVPIAAFTATATHRVQQDIITRLGLRSPCTLRTSFNRPNLFYEVQPKEDVNGQVFDFVKNRAAGESGIVYRMSRRGVEETAAFLTSNGIRALAYHAGLDEQTRERNQDAFNRDTVQVVVATIAFGMGIDKSNVRFVLHGDLPRSMESYYQETGRAGRDGEPARCLLFFGRGDIPRARHFIENVDNEQERARGLHSLNEVVAFAEHQSCRRAKLLAYFGEHSTESDCGGCDICSGERVSLDITTQAQMVLSAVVRSGGRFGAGHIVDILTGASTKQIRTLRHDMLKTYGVGKGSSKRSWRQVIDELCCLNLLSQSSERFPVLQLTEQALAVLKGEQSVTVLRAPQQTVVEQPVGTIDTAPSNRPLFEHLKDLRRRCAEQRGVPPFVIFSDRSLHEMASRLPLTNQELLEVNGVGAVKLEQFGELFLNCIGTYVAQHPECKSDAVAKGSVTIENRVKKTVVMTPTLEQTYALMQQGLDIGAIAAARGFAQSTITDHVEKLVGMGKAVTIDVYIAPHKREQIVALYARINSTLLGDAMTACNGDFTYDELRLVRSWMRHNHTTPVESDVVTMQNSEGA
jgi:ATP-dependent DNA helicase RecQ